MILKKTKYRNSISKRLTTRVLVVSALIFTLTFTAFLRMAANKVREEVSKHAHSELSSTIHQIDAILKSVEIAVENMAWIVPHELESPDAMYEITMQLLKNNEFIYGSSVAFEPNYFSEKGYYFSPYAYKDKSEGIKYKQLGNESYDYHYMDWYQIPKLLKEAYWTEPYYDDGGGEAMMTTYSKPLYDEEGNMYAVITADISLEWLTGLVGDIHAFNQSYNLMVSRNASFIVHPNRNLILNETIFSSTYGEYDESLKKMQEDMLNCKASEVLREKDGHKFFVFYAPVETNCWSVAIVCPLSELYAGVKRLRGFLIILGVAALIIMIILSYNGIRKVVAPIEDFSSAAMKIADGDFNVSLPEIRTQDELKELHDSFEHLQKSLVKYIDELKTTTANKERIESELRIAHAIQMGMIPKIFPPFPERNDLSLSAKLVPAKEVGGDLYDFFIENEKLYFIIGDVSGKGVPASLVMAVTCRLFRSIASHFDKPEEIIASLNDSLSDGNESNMFCTAFLGIMDLATGKLLYCNAGHNAPLLIGPGKKVKEMKVTPNLPLGLFGGFPYEGESITIEKDSMIYLFTDGVNEAENREKLQYGDDRLASLLESLSSQGPTEIVKATFDDVKEHANGAEQSDDITVMCIKYI